MRASYQRRVGRHRDLICRFSTVGSVSLTTLALFTEQFGIMHAFTGLAALGQVAHCGAWYRSAGRHGHRAVRGDSSRESLHATALP
jgi:hypothetical protein